MTDQTSENEIIEKKPTNRSNFGFIIVIIAGLIFAFACSYGYIQLVKFNVFQQHAMTDLQAQLAKTQTEMSGLQQTIADLKSASLKSQDLSAKQEQMLTEWQAAQKGDLNKWYVAEAQHLVKLANDYLQFSYDDEMALTLLQRADQVLQNLSDANLMEIRKSLTTDIANLQAVPKVDVTGLYLRLNAINNQIDQLTLPINPLQQKEETRVVSATNEPWWKTGINHTWEALRKFVIVRNTNASSLPLVMPEEKIFFYQNLHAQMEAAMWAVLHHNNDVYHASLTRAINWVQQYFDANAGATKNMLATLQDLQKENLQPAKVNLSNTLQLLDGYMK